MSREISVERANERVWITIARTKTDREQYFCLWPDEAQLLQHLLELVLTDHALTAARGQ